MDAYGNLQSASASLCTNYLSVVFNMFEKYATADPTQYAAGVRAFARMLEFLCQSSSSDGCRGTFWVWCLKSLCLSPLSSTVLPLTVMCTEITRALIVAGRHLSDPFERAMCTILEYRGVTAADVMRFFNAFTLREDEVASLMGLFQVGVVTKVRYGADDVMALQRKMLLPNATRRVMPVSLELLAAYLGRAVPAAGLAEHSMSPSLSCRPAVTVVVYLLLLLPPFTAVAFKRLIDMGGIEALPIIIPNVFPMLGAYVVHCMTVDRPVVVNVIRDVLAFLRGLRYTSCMPVLRLPRRNHCRYGRVS
jgi:hypothetical protein